MFPYGGKFLVNKKKKKKKTVDIQLSAHDAMPESEQVN